MVQNAAQPFGRSPQEPILSNSKKIGLLVGLLFGEKEKFYIDSLKTGVGKRSLSTLLMSSPRIKNETSTADMLRFLHDEGDRTSYSILLPLLLTAHTKEELAKSIRERFFGIELFVEKGIRLYDFILAMQTENDLFIGEKEVKRGLLGWDMGRLVCLARIASDSGTISNDTAWKFIESAGKQCQANFGSWEELGKSILIGQAMESAEQEDLKDMIRIFRQAMNSENSPWNHFSLSTT